MKRVILICLLLVSFMTISTTVTAQKGHKKHHQTHHKKHHQSHVYRSKHRPVTIVVYHPHWSPKKDFHRRWVYFPTHKIYWDNWRQAYYYHNGKSWISTKTLPSHHAALKLENENHYELDESQDEDDEVYEHLELGTEVK